MGGTSSKSKPEHLPRPGNTSRGHSQYGQPPLQGYQGAQGYGQGYGMDYRQGSSPHYSAGMTSYGQGPGAPYGRAPPSYGRGFIPNSGPVIPQGYGNNYSQMPQPQIPQPTEARQRTPIPGESQQREDAQEARDRRESRETRETSTRRRKTRRRTMTGTITFSSNGEAPASGNSIGSGFTEVPPHAEAASPHSTGRASRHSFQDNSRRMPTPFYRPPSIQASNSQGSQSQSYHLSPSHSVLNRSASTSNNHRADPVPSPTHARRSSTPSRLQSRPARGTDDTHAPVSPIRERTFTTESQARSPNPLPEPPRDIFATTPYRHLLTPKELPAITTTPSEGTFVRREIIHPPKPPKKGLFRAFSSKKSAPQPSKTIQYVYVPSLSSHHRSASKASSSMAATPAVAPTPAPAQAPAPAPAPTPGPSHAPPTPTTQSAPETPTTREPQTLPPIYFDQESEYSYFLIHSPHTVWYDDEEYPTAAHLLESFKFLPEYPAIAEQLRKCEDTEELYRLSTEYDQYRHPDYASHIVENMRKVIELKFKQHANLRYVLCNTDPARLVYNDPSDSFWGIGPTGRGKNELGAVLEQVRAELKPQRK